MTNSPKSRHPDLLMGGGAGVLLVTLAENIADPTYRSAVLYASPIVSMAVGSAVSWLRNFGAREIMIRYKRWDLDRVKVQLADILNNPEHPQSFKDEAREKVRRHEMNILTIMMQDLSSFNDSKDK